MDSNTSRKICSNHTDRPLTLLWSQIFSVNFSRMSLFFHFAPQSEFKWNEKCPTRKRETGSSPCFSKWNDMLSMRMRPRNEGRIFFSSTKPVSRKGTIGRRRRWSSRRRSTVRWYISGLQEVWDTYRPLHGTTRGESLILDVMAFENSDAIHKRLMRHPFVWMSILHCGSDRSRISAGSFSSRTSIQSLSHIWTRYRSRKNWKHAKRCS
jgi:hypothetical protein